MPNELHELNFEKSVMENLYFLVKKYVTVAVTYQSEDKVHGFSVDFSFGKCQKSAQALGFMV